LFLFEAEEAFWREVTEVVLKGEIPVAEKEDDTNTVDPER